MSATEADLDFTLAGFAGHVGSDPDCIVMMPPIIMPMHLAIDATPCLVRPRSGAPVFLKIYAPDMLPFIDLDAAVAAATRAGQCGIGPAVIAHDADRSAVLFDFLAPDAWRMASRADLETIAVRSAIFAAKRAWHRSGLLGRTRSPFEVIRAYRERINSLAERTPSASTLPLAFHTLADWTERIERGIAAAGIDLAPLHGENALSNVMLGPANEVRLVDFDQAANGDPLYDVGAFCLEFCSFDDEIEAAVELYLGHSDQRAVARAKLYMIVDDFLWGCWALLAHATSPRATTVEFYKYAQNRLLRGTYWLGVWDADSLLRRA
ncbi:MAG: phosphotransferase [Xanthobacteraceae bacterium]|nr:phosphotransferase [Xanthobacteraceae bacterium]